MTSNRVEFDTYEVIARFNVNLGDISILRATGMGSIVVEVLVRGKTRRICIKHVLHVPNL